MLGLFAAFINIYFMTTNLKPDRTFGDCPIPMKGAFYGKMASETPAAYLLRLWNQSRCRGELAKYVRYHLETLRKEAAAESEASHDHQLDDFESNFETEE